MGDLFGSQAASRIAARVLAEEGTFDVEEELHAMSIRVPASLRNVIDELASDTGLSRNMMAIELLRAGVHDVLSKLPPQVAQEYLADHEGEL